MTVVSISFDGFLAESIRKKNSMLLALNDDLLRFIFAILETEGDAGIVRFVCARFNALIALAYTRATANLTRVIWAVKMGGRPTWAWSFAAICDDNVAVLNHIHAVGFVKWTYTERLRSFQHAISHKLLDIFAWLCRHGVWHADFVYETAASFVDAGSVGFQMWNMLYDKRLIGYFFVDDLENMYAHDMSSRWAMLLSQMC